MQGKMDTLKALICPDRMLETAEAVSKHHRIQASTGYRAAAQYCLERLHGLGLEAELLSYPADGQRRSRTNRTLLEWDIQGGQCEIEGFGQIANYQSAPLSVICRSMGCDFRSGPLEVVYLDKSDNPADYEGIDLAGKLAFVRGNINGFAWVCQQRGGLGLITDFVLRPEEHQQVMRYTSFWWRNDPDEIRYFGFCLTPEQGKALAEHCLYARERGQPVLARGYIDASYYPGALEVVSAVLPGQTKEEILVTAHLCHPTTSSNDNASGVAACIEGLYAIKRAVEAGSIVPLRRTIRLLLLPEMTGTVAYLQGIGADKASIAAAINLDMVGGRQDPGYGPLVLTCLPRSTPSFTEYAAMLALEYACQGYSSFNPAVKLPAVSWALSDFSGGSDHYILSDPTVGIPCTMLGQWPDKFYHTSGDTMERLSEDTLAASCATMAAFCASLAGLTPGDLPALMARGKLRFAQELAALRTRTDAAELGQHLLAAYRTAVADAARFFEGDGAVAQLIAQEQGLLGGLLAAFIPQGEVPAVPQSDSRVPKRRWDMPIDNIDLAAQLCGKQAALSAYESGPRRQVHEPMITEPLMCYYIDGKRTVSDIIRCTELDTGVPQPGLAAYIELLWELELISF